MRAIKNKLEAFGSSNQHVRLMTSNELDKCLREALYTDTVGCSDSILFDISQATYHEAFFERIMKAAWSCVGSRAGKIRRIQKGLNLLNYLAINGSERCISDIIAHVDILHSLPKLKFGKNNTELSMLVIEKASQLSALVLDSKTLQDKRKYAASIRDRFVSVGSTNGYVETDVLHKPVFVLDKTKNTPQDMGSVNGFPGGFGSHGVYSGHPAMHSRSMSRLAINQMITKHTGRKFLSRLFRNSLKVSDNPHNMGLFGTQPGSSFADYQVTGANLGYGMGSGNLGGFPDGGAPTMGNYDGQTYRGSANFVRSNSVGGVNYPGPSGRNSMMGSNMSNQSAHDYDFNAFPVINNTNDSYYKHSFAGPRFSNRASNRTTKAPNRLGSSNRTSHRALSNIGIKSDDSSFKHRSSTSDSDYSSSSSVTSDSDSYASYENVPTRVTTRTTSRAHSRGYSRRSSYNPKTSGYGRHHRVDESEYSDASSSTSGDSSESESSYESSGSEYESSEYYVPNDRRHPSHYHGSHTYSNRHSQGPKVYANGAAQLYDRYTNAGADDPHYSGGRRFSNNRDVDSHRPYSGNHRSYNGNDRTYSANEYSGGARDYHRSGCTRDAYGAPSDSNARYSRNYRPHDDSYHDRSYGAGVASHNSGMNNPKYHDSYRAANNSYSDHPHAKHSVRESYAPGPVGSTYSRPQNPFTRA